jgi:cytoskeletal protein CcmA (bactofilin family)
MNEHITKNMTTDDVRNAIEKEETFTVPVGNGSESYRHINLDNNNPKTPKEKTEDIDSIEKTKKPSEVTILSARIKMDKSNISTEDDMIIHGRYENGILSCNILTITPGAYVSGQINAKEIKNQGYLEGQINTKHFYAYEHSTTTGTVEAVTIGIQVNANILAKFTTRNMMKEDEKNNDELSVGSISISSDEQ